MEEEEEEEEEAMYALWSETLRRSRLFRARALCESDQKEEQKEAATPTPRTRTRRTRRAASNSSESSPWNGNPLTNPQEATPERAEGAHGAALPRLLPQSPHHHHHHHKEEEEEEEEEEGRQRRRRQRPRDGRGVNGGRG